MLAPAIIPGLLYINIEGIIRCQAEANHLTFYLTDQSKLIIPKSLDEYEEMLSAYGFFRIHHAHLINLRHIKNFTNGQSNLVTMTDDSAIEVAQAKKKKFLKRLGRV